MPKMDRASVGRVMTLLLVALALCVLLPGCGGKAMNLRCDTLPFLGYGAKDDAGTVALKTLGNVGILSAVLALGLGLMVLTVAGGGR